MNGWTVNRCTVWKYIAASRCICWCSIIIWWFTNSIAFSNTWQQCMATGYSERLHKLLISAQRMPQATTAAAGSVQHKSLSSSVPLICLVYPSVPGHRNEIQSIMTMWLKIKRPIDFNSTHSHQGFFNYIFQDENKCSYSAHHGINNSYTLKDRRARDLVHHILRHKLALDWQGEAWNPLESPIIEKKNMKFNKSTEINKPMNKNKSSNIATNMNCLCY